MTLITVTQAMKAEFSILNENNVFKTQHPVILAGTIENFLSYIPGGKVLDLGSGLGYQLATLEMFGFKAYGVEKFAKIAKASKEKLKAFGFTPRIFVGDYFEDEIIFPDMNRLQDMQGIICYSYHICHHWNILMNFMTKPEVTVGTYAFIDEWGTGLSDHSESMEMFYRAGLEIVEENLPIIRKIKPSNLHNAEIYSFLSRNYGYTRDDMF